MTKFLGSAAVAEPVLDEHVGDAGVMPLQFLDGITVGGCEVADVELEDERRRERQHFGQLPGADRARWVAVDLIVDRDAKLVAREHGRQTFRDVQSERRADDGHAERFRLLQCDRVSSSVNVSV